jgi:uncharacterized membrane protein YkvI
MNFMMVLHAVPVALSFLVLAAHFLRGEWMILSVVSLILPILLLVPRLWSARVMQLALFLGAMEWMRTLGQLVEIRMQLGQPWTRMAIILGTVALFTALSALVFQSRDMARRYRLRSEG